MSTQSNMPTLTEEVRKLVKKELQPLADKYCILLDPTLLTENLLFLIQSEILKARKEERALVINKLKERNLLKGDL